jgi:hypothetical protein
MPYDWEGAAEGGQAEKLPAGTHDVTITKVIFSKKDAAPFRAGDGSPQIMVVMADGAGREVGQMITLSDKAGWVLARLMGASGANLGRMKADGVVPQHFADPAWATKQLVGRKLRVDIKWKPDGYPDVTPIRRDPGAAPSLPPLPGAAGAPAARPAAPPPPVQGVEDDIPDLSDAPF